MNIVKSETVVDSKGVSHVFNLIRSIGGYTFTWDGKQVDWSFTVHGLMLKCCLDSVSIFIMLHQRKIL